MSITWARRADNGYEVSSRGDARFSALHATLGDGRCIEAHYQCDVKGIAPGSSNWRLGKGKPPVNSITQEESWDAYLELWRQWAAQHTQLMTELAAKVGPNGILTDRFASTQINQARALSVLINEEEENTMSDTTSNSPSIDTSVPPMGAPRSEIEELRSMIEAQRTEINELRSTISGLRAQPAKDVRRLAGKAKAKAKAKYVPRPVPVGQQVIWNARKAAMEAARAEAMRSGKTVAVEF